MFLIPDDILNNLTCDECKKYLSVSPVKVYPDKRILCGRCSKDNDDGMISLYEKIIQKGVFRCINRYDGCNQALLYSEVASHEAACISKLYNCPICMSATKMSSLLLVSHFEKHHKGNVLRSPFFSIDTGGPNVGDIKYLYIKEDFLFLICSSVNSNCIELNTFHIGDKSASKEITQRFILPTSDGTLMRYFTRKLPCCSYEETCFNEPHRIVLDTGNCSLNLEIDLNTKKNQKLLLLPMHGYHSWLLPTPQTKPTRQTRPKPARPTVPTEQTQLAQQFTVENCQHKDEPVAIERSAATIIQEFHRKRVLKKKIKQLKREIVTRNQP